VKRTARSSGTNTTGGLYITIRTRCGRQGDMDELKLLSRVHLSLAIVYRQLGLLDLAAHHREMCRRTVQHMIKTRRNER
jgi:hypothetical protein